MSTNGKTLKFRAAKLKGFTVLHTNSPCVFVILVCSNGGSTYFVCEVIAKDNLNIENLMQTFENLLLQNYLTKFLDIAHK